MVNAIHLLLSFIHTKLHCKSFGTFILSVLQSDIFSVCTALETCFTYTERHTRMQLHFYSDQLNVLTMKGNFLKEMFPQTVSISSYLVVQVGGDDKPRSQRKLPVKLGNKTTEVLASDLYHSTKKMKLS